MICNRSFRGTSSSVRVGSRLCARLSAAFVVVQAAKHAGSIIPKSFGLKPEKATIILYEATQFVQECERDVQREHDHEDGSDLLRMSRRFPKFVGELNKLASRLKSEQLSEANMNTLTTAAAMSLSATRAAAPPTPVSAVPGHFRASAATALPPPNSIVSSTEPPGVRPAVLAINETLLFISR